MYLSLTFFKATRIGSLFLALARIHCNQPRYLELITVKLDFRARITARQPSSCNFYSLYGISTLENVYLFLIFRQLHNYFRFVQVSRYIDKWLNTNDPPAPSGGPTQSPPEGAGGSFVNTYTVLHIFRQVLFWAGN